MRVPGGDIMDSVRNKKPNSENLYYIESNYLKIARYKDRLFHPNLRKLHGGVSELSRH